MSPGDGNDSELRNKFYRVYTIRWVTDFPDAQLRKAAPSSEAALLKPLNGT